MIIDATDAIVGRMATVAAKKALLGEKVDIVNCERAVVTGNRDQIMARFKQKKDFGAPLKGPYYSRMPDRMVRRVVRGMLPFKNDRGRKAFGRVMCYIGVPENLKSQKIEKIKEADVSKMPSLKYVYIDEISRFLGARI
ncbi:MAG TPA: 50S ribosomal protein L13 [Candidatus Nanoarchaeia archaeon]|nr:50S ribosomal protein L13 [Candidatus Nanoarchaeia archaeon]